MSAERIAFRYAKSLLDLASERNQTDEVFSDIQGFKKLVEESKDLQHLIFNPTIKPSKKRSIFSKIFSGKVNDMTSKFFDIVLRKGRENLLVNISESFEEQYNEMKGITDVTLISATKLSERALSEIKEKLRASNLLREQVHITEEIDESLIGGFILDFGDKQYDASVAGKLNKLRNKFN